MAGIYLHIPFCKKACHYCDFHFSTSPKQIRPMILAICKEAALRRGYINENISTIYFGGGTPSLLQMEDCWLLIEKLHDLFMIDDDAELTLEANPDDITREKTAQWKSAGINRLSIGVQSFFDEDLQWMNRAHNARQARQSVETALSEGFENISIDLIYGMSTLSDERWRQNVETALSLHIPHLSCYALTVEKGTALDKMITNQKVQNIDEEIQIRHFELLMQWMQDAGYEHYEISNFAKPGFRSRHNSSYWHGKHYLGLGPSAHSFNGNSRQWNVSNNILYIQSLEKNIVPYEVERLNPTQKLNEYIMTSLRTKEGLSLEHVSKKWETRLGENIQNDAAPFLKNDFLMQSNRHLVLTNKGKLFADGIAVELFQDEPEVDDFP